MPPYIARLSVERASISAVAVAALVCFGGIFRVCFSHIIFTDFGKQRVRSRGSETKITYHAMRLQSEWRRAPQMILLLGDAAFNIDLYAIQHP